MSIPHRWTCAATLAALAAAGPAQALDAAWSGFATLGYARTDSDYRQQRYIDRDGTLKRDSLIAGQLDLQLAPQWSATVQAKLAAPDDRDDGIRARTTWAFLAWRPDNDWLVRAGRVRMPLYMHSESLDVGVARDMVRLPHEMYSVSPTNEINGIVATRTANWGATELSVDAFVGSDRTATRMWISEGVPPYVAPGASYKTVKTKFSGLALTARDGGLTWRLGVGASTTTDPGGKGFSRRYPRVDIAPGLGYWKVDAAIPGPEIETTPKLHNEVIGIGVDWQIGAGWRLWGEAARLHQSDAEFPYDAHGAYLALFKRVGAFTPYVSVARQRSGRRLLDWHDRLAHQSLPAVVPDGALIAAAQQVAADSLLAIDQRSLGLGTSYRLSARAKLHAEWLRTAVGRTSSHFDVMPGQRDAAGQHAVTTSLALSVAF